MFNGVIERKISNISSPFRRDWLDTDSGRIQTRRDFLSRRSLVDRLDQFRSCRESRLEFDPCVQVFGVFANDYKVDVRFAEIGTDPWETFARTKTGIQTEFLAQKHVDRTKSFTDRGSNRGLQSDLIFTNRGKDRIRNFADLLDYFDTTFLDIPTDFNAGGFDASSGCFGNLRTDTIAWNKSNIIHIDW